jgi:hypothetical protein
MKIHLIQSALNQNTGTELQGDLGACSQGSPAMGCDEEARLRGLVGKHLGLIAGRAPVLRAKSDPGCPIAGSSRVTYAVSDPRLDQVQRVFMTSAWQAYLTGELPRRSEASPRKTSSYKLDAKGSGQAAVTQRTSYAFGLQGTQQSQSSPALRRDQRLNLRQFEGNEQLLGTVSPLTAATKWPAGTSFRPMSEWLRNIPRGRRLLPERS